jgi:hypothetical protein
VLVIVDVLPFMITNQLPWTAGETEVPVTEIIHPCVVIVKFNITYKIQCMDIGMTDSSPELFLDLFHLVLNYFF